MGKEIEVEEIYDNYVVIRVGEIHIKFRREMDCGIERITSSSRFRNSRYRKSTYIKSDYDFKEAFEKARSILHRNGAPSKRKKIEHAQRRAQPATTLTAKIFKSPQRVFDF